MTEAQSILDQKFAESYRLIEQEKKHNRIVGKVETLLLLAAIGLFVAFVQYTFWGKGFSAFLSETHDASVASLVKMPGPHAELMENAMATKGYVSWIDYSAYIDMANQYKRESMHRANQLATK